MASRLLTSALLMFALVKACAFSNVVHTIQNFSAGIPGSWITVTGLQMSASGYTNWGYYSPMGETNFHSWMVVSNQSFTYPAPVTVPGGILHSNTGPRAVEYWHKSSNNVEAIDLILPGGGNVLFSNMLVRAFVQFGAFTTNNSANFDHFYIEGGAFCACQQQTSGNGTTGTVFNLKAHAQLNSGASDNGAIISIDRTRWYYMELLRDRVRSKCELRLYDPITFELIGESVANLGDAWGSFRMRLQAHYSTQGFTHGTTSVAGLVVTFSNATPAITMEYPMATLIRSNRLVWSVGTNVGVRGGIPERTGTVIDVTQSPYNADNTGVNDAGGAFNSAITAASSNDIVYAPAGVYNLATTISLNKSGVLLRGAGGSNTILVGGITTASTGGGEFFAIHGGATNSSTNLMMSDVTDAFGSVIAAGDHFEITQIEDEAVEAFPVWSASNERRKFGQIIEVLAVSNGTNLHIHPKLYRNYTNVGKLRSLNLTGQSGTRWKRAIGLEDFAIRPVYGSISNNAVTLINFYGVKDGWIKGITANYPISYCLSIQRNLNVQFESNYFGQALSVGNSRSGITAAEVSGMLLQNNIFEDLSIGFQTQGGSFSGNAVFANYFTNISDKAMLVHTHHSFYNLWEADDGNVIVHDGYFGSQSHDDIFRCRVYGTFGGKRNVTHMNYNGNVLGDTNLPFKYEETASAYTTPYPIFAFGYPHIGNNAYTGTTPPMGFNFPGPITTASGSTYTNFGQEFNGTYGPTNVLWTNMLANFWTFTNIPQGSAGGLLPIAFQDGVNTNRWWPGGDGTLMYATSAGTPSNVTLNAQITVSNGWRLFIVGSEAFNQRNGTNGQTHFASGNRVYTNTTGVQVFDGRTTATALPPSLLHPNSKPTWWPDTNQWPFAFAEGETNAVGILPAKARLATMKSGAPETPPGQAKSRGPGFRGAGARVRKF